MQQKMNKKLVLLILSFFTMTSYSQDKELKLNHIYFVIDSSTFNKIKYNKKLHNLVNIDKGIPSFDKIDSTSTTLYLRGKSTYIEIMGPNNKFNEKVGSMGLGFSWDTNDTINNNFSKKTVKTSNIKFISSDAKWMFANNEVLWFTAFYTELKGFISTWYAYYNPKFLSGLFGQEHSTFTRELFLKNAYSKEKPITDLAEIILNCSGEDFTKITTELSSFSLKSKNVKSRSAVYYLGTVKLTLKKANDNKSSIKTLKFATKSQIDKKTNDYGNIELINMNNNVIFNFK